MSKHLRDSPEALIPGVVEALRTRQLPHRILGLDSRENLELTRWIESKVTFLGTRIDWSVIKGHSCEEWDDEATDAACTFSQAAAQADLTDIAHITWSDATCPTIEMLLGDAVQIAGQLFEASHDTYVVQVSKLWMLELYHEGTICWGFLE